jgi:hypothetical protein
MGHVVFSHEDDAGSAEGNPVEVGQFVFFPVGHFDEKWHPLFDGCLNPKSEIETGNLPQSLGHKRIEKISTDRFGYASIFSIRLCSNILRHLAGLNFGFRVESWLSS